MAGWWRAFSIVLVAALGAVVAAALDGKALGAVIGAVIGGVCGAFAPTLLERSRARAEALEALAKVAELRPDVAGPASLLHPSRGVVPFTGRERELAELLAWCADADAGRLRLVTGPGGVGKSRLAVQLAEELGAGWGVLEVADDSEAEALARWRAVNEEQVLLVVDYAETRTGLAGLLREVAGDEGRRVRVLLLARTAGEWWRQLGAESARVREMVTAAEAGKMELAEEVRAGTSDRELVAAAVPHFAAALNVQPPKGFEVVLGEGPQRILDLHAAALVAVLRSTRSGTGKSGVVVQVGEVLEEVLGHERRFWVQSARAQGLMDGAFGLSEEVVRQTVAAGTLLGAKDREQAVKVAGRVPDGMASVRVADWLRELYPPDDDREWLGRLRPDRLAELHITQELSGSAELLKACLEGLDAQQGRRALVTLARATQELQAASELLQRLLPSVTGEVGSIPAPRETLLALHEVLPYPSLILADAHALLARRLLDSVPTDAGAAERARWLLALGAHLWKLSQTDEALPLTEEAVALYQGLAEAYPDRHRPNLAASLSNLGGEFSELGRPAEALSVIREAVALYRELAEAYPDRYRPDLATSLTNHGLAFSELGRPAEALPVTEEAVAIRRELAEAYPDRHRPDLALSLTSLGNQLSELGRSAEALPVTEEAVAIRRELAEAYPDRYRPSLAASLTSLGTQLSELGRSAEALPVTEEAVAILRELAEAYPDRYRPSLAGSLSNLGGEFWVLGRIDEALPVTEEAVAILRELAEAYPDRHRPNLAGSLTNLGGKFSELGRSAEALSVTEEAVAILRELAEAYPDRHRPNLATSLSNHGLAFSELGRSAEALSVTEEAVAILRELAEAYPDRYRSRLAISLTNLGNQLSELGRTDEAAQVGEEAERIRGG
ncbi:tetratricopeptide repeat protein [Streptosporangium sp. NPDC005286]|uniref:tetratricopeptide repeat protein n=1 Tax=Streptosporangium sp. NPDC005286 TaxID=3154463 RepID=UPI0033BD2C15